MERYNSFFVKIDIEGSILIVLNHFHRRVYFVKALFSLYGQFVWYLTYDNVSSNLRQWISS